MIFRDIFATLEEECTNSKITALNGARQVGKSTALKYIYRKQKNANYISFDNASVKELFETNIDLFIEQYILPYNMIFIDEFQYAKEGGKKLKYIHDLHSKKIFISGSSKPEIAIQSLQYLVGRVSLIEMYPLSFAEFVRFKSPQKAMLLDKPRSISDLTQLRAEFTEYLMFGGYPDVVIEKNFEKKEKILSDLVRVYLLKEIKDVLGYKNSDDFQKLLVILASQNGCLGKISSLSKHLQISWDKLKEYLSVLTKTNIILAIKPFFTNKSKELTKTAKYYFHDIGFINSLLNNFSTIEKRVDKGTLYETFILHELQKKGYEPKFWNKQLSEVDFILEKNANICAIECKSIVSKVPKSLKIFLEEYLVLKSFIFTENFEEKKKEIQFTHYINVSSLEFFQI